MSFRFKNQLEEMTVNGNKKIYSSKKSIVLYAIFKKSFN